MIRCCELIIVNIPVLSSSTTLQIVATEVCHSDTYTLEGHNPEGIFTCVLGHERGGIEIVGEGVT